MAHSFPLKILSNFPGHCEVLQLAMGKSLKFHDLLWPTHSNINVLFLADRTIGRAFGILCRLSVCLSSVICRRL